MKKHTKHILCSIFFTFLFFSVSAQITRYYQVLFKKEYVKYRTEPGFDKFIFSFKETSPGYYILEGAAFDENNHMIKVPFRLPQIPGRPDRPLKNLLPGTLTLTKTVMDDNHMDAGYNYSFKPQKYKDHSTGEESDYVSYSVQVYNSKKQVLTSFTIDPSPPAK